MLLSQSDLFINFNMAVSWIVRVLLLICSFFEYFADDSQRVNRFEYKFSFKGPHLVNKNGQVPFWTVGGSAIPSDDQVRITPSLRDKKGYMWSKNQYTGDSFEIEVAFKVTGQGRVGADGMAIWFTEVQGQEGAVFGSSSPWKGLGILLDSFDNDGQSNNPFISIMVNDGTLTYEHHSDGHNQAQGGCLRNFRNRPYPIRIKARYYENVLTVWFHPGMAEKPEYELCTRVEDIHLPKTGVFGVSAATGGLADDHDVISFATHSITSPSDAKKKMSEDELKKLSEQYDQMTEKFQKEKDEYAKAHPKEPSQESQFETSYDRDLRLIYEGQNAVHHIVNNLHKKTGELTTQVNELQRIMSAGNVGGGGQDAISRQEVNSIINLQNQLTSGMEEVKNLVRGLSGGVVKRDVGDNGGNNAGDISDLRNSMEIMMENINHLVTKQQFAGKDHGKNNEKGCPPVEKPNCIGPGYFVFLVVAQMVTLLAYFTYKSQKEAANKKFF